MSGRTSPDCAGSARLTRKVAHCAWLRSTHGSKLTSSFFATAICSAGSRATLAAYEGLYKGQKDAPMTVFGIVNGDKKPGDKQSPFLMEIQVPGVLGLLSTRGTGNFLPGIDDLVYGNKDQNIMPAADKISRGKEALRDLAAYKKAKKAGDAEAAKTSLEAFKKNQQFMGYGYLQKPEDLVPPVGLTFYSFHLMVALFALFALLFVVFLVGARNNTLVGKRWLLQLGVASFFLAMIGSQAGWIVAEVGRQPWAIQDMLPVGAATTNIGAGSVQATFFLFLAVFTLLLFAEIKIMARQINIGPEGV